MSNTGIEPLESACRAIFAGLKRHWAADDRFGGVLLTYPSEDTSVPQQLRAHLTQAWDADTVARASDRVKQLVRKLGNLDAGQKLMHSDPEADAMLYAAIWPWGNGQTVSLRIGYALKTPDADNRSARDSLFRGWFGLAK